MPMIGTNSPQVIRALNEARHNVAHLTGPIRNIHTLPVGTEFRYQPRHHLNYQVAWRILRASYVGRHGRSVDITSVASLYPIGSTISGCDSLEVIVLRDFADDYSI